MIQPLSIDSYRPIVSYYDDMKIFYQRIWAEHLHFGLFDGLPKGIDWTIDEAGVEYSKQLILNGLAALPLHRRGKKLIIIELCCGSAPIFPYLVELGLEGSYFGVDIRTESIDNCNDKYKPGGKLDNTKMQPSFVNETAESFLCSFKCEADMIVCQDSFYHMKDKSYVLDMANKKLKSCGILLLSDFTINDSLQLDKSFNKYFIKRQADSIPLTFIKNGLTRQLFNTVFNFSKRNNYDFTNRLTNANYHIIKVIDQTTNLQLTYKKALANIKTKRENNEFIMSDESFKFCDEAFTYLAGLGKSRDMQLLWWIAAKKPNRPTISLSSDEVDLELIISNCGYSHKYDYRNNQIIDCPLLGEMTLAVKAKEYLGLVGKNGIGKTTLLNAIIGFLPYDKNLTIIKKPAKIAIVNQDPILFDQFTVADAIQLVFSINVVNRLFNSPLEIIKACSLSGVVGQQMNQLSRGERQRAAIALALASNPEMLLLDEPFASQDYVQKSEMINLLNKLKKYNITVIHVTHNWEELDNLADRFIEVTGGQLIEFKAR
jgi:ABC-type nitrate/sulfonate/bicarbonate transport system ATPase subunit/SAM-dependent methyltransferase